MKILKSDISSQRKAPIIIENINNNNENNYEKFVR